MKCYNLVKLKYGIIFPWALEESLSLYEENRNYLWKNSITKERANVAVSMKLLNLVGRYLQACKKITGHWVFDIKIYLVGKERFVVGDHLINLPQAVT